MANDELIKELVNNAISALLTDEKLQQILTPLIKKEFAEQVIPAIKEKITSPIMDPDMIEIIMTAIDDRMIARFEKCAESIRDDDLT